MLYLRDSNCNKKKKKYWNKMKRRFVYKRDYSFAYNGNINFVLKILTNAALSEGRHSILVPCFFFFPFLNACQQQLSKDGIPLARSLERE